MISPGNKNRMACVVCGCTQERGCPGGCGWSSLKTLTQLNCDGPLCTICADVVHHLAMYADIVHRFRVAPLLRAVNDAAGATAPPRKARAACRA